MPTHGGSLRLFSYWANSVRKRIDRVEKVLDVERAASLDTDTPCVAFVEQAREAKRSLLELLIGLKRQGKSIVGYGAAAKGNTLLNDCGVGADILDCVVARPPYKQGMFLPGTRLEIRAPEVIDQCKPDYVLILPWNLQDEVTVQLAHVANWGARFIVPIHKARIIEAGAADGALTPHVSKLVGGPRMSRTGDIRGQSQDERIRRITSEVKPVRTKPERSGRRNSAS